MIIDLTASNNVFSISLSLSLAISYLISYYSFSSSLSSHSSFSFKTSISLARFLFDSLYFSNSSDSTNYSNFISLLRAPISPSFIFLNLSKIPVLTSYYSLLSADYNAYLVLAKLAFFCITTGSSSASCNLSELSSYLHLFLN